MFEKEDFLAGLNSKIQWHDLRKNPNDLLNQWLILLGVKYQSLRGRK